MIEFLESLIVRPPLLAQVNVYTTFILFFWHIVYSAYRRAYTPLAYIEAELAKKILEYST